MLLTKDGPLHSGPRMNRLSPLASWDLWKSMTEADIEIILQGAKEKYPEARPRIISDNGPQFIDKDFKSSFGSRA